MESVPTVFYPTMEAKAMTDEQILYTVLIIIGIALIGICIIYPFWDLKKNKKKYDDELEKHIESKFAEEADIISLNAEVVDMVCGCGMVGSYHLPKSKKTFLVVFKSEGGEIFELPVPEEYYLELSVGQKGKLTLCEGNLDSFELE